MSQKYPGGFITKSPPALIGSAASGMWTLDQAMQLKKQGLWPPNVPGAPTIGTATQTGSTTATVVFTAPASNGGVPITSYTATSSPSGGTGTLSQAGSGTITVSGLTASTSYTFTVTATNAIGTSPASAASNSITTPANVPTVIGQAFGGGYYAGQIGSSSVAEYYLIVAPLSSGQANKSYNSANQTTTGADSAVNGLQNTADLVAQYTAVQAPAAHFCNDLSVGGETDWYMPARNELEICYYNLKPGTASNNTSSGINPNAIPARASNYTAGNPAQTSATIFRTGSTEPFYGLAPSVPADYYWSSTKATQPWANLAQFYNGIQYSSGVASKYVALKVRAVRRIAV